MISKQIDFFLEDIKKEFGQLPKDLHVTRKAMAFVAISNGKIIKSEEPLINNCPLFERLFKTKEITQDQVKRKFNWQIEKFGMFSCRRDFSSDEIIVPFGASEILMYAINRGEIEAAVVVCEGAGTVISSKSSLVQAIGAYLNGIFYTSPIKSVLEKIKNEDGVVLSQDAAIDQFEGVKKAFNLGFKKIAVTIRGDEAFLLEKIRRFEKDKNILVTILVVCNSGISENDACLIKKKSDLVWACGSKYIRSIVAPDAILQLGMKIPVFALSKKGLALIASYSDDFDIKKLSIKHYITANKYKEGSVKINMGRFKVFLYETDCLPVKAIDEPSPLF